MALVFGWMFLSPHLKTRRLGLEFKGVKVYEKESFVKEQIASKLEVYEEESAFDLDPIPEPPKPEPVSINEAEFVDPEEQFD